MAVPMPAGPEGAEGAGAEGAAGAASSSYDYQDAPIEGEFTIRAVILGLLIGVLLCLTNLFFGLQSGWISMMSLQAALIGFGLGKLQGRGLSVRENVVVQTTAVGVGTLPLAAGLVGIVPALSQLSPDSDGAEPIVLSAWHLIAWCLATAFFGVFFAVPLRKQVIIKEKLVFPSGTATAQLISVLHHAPLRDESASSVSASGSAPRRRNRSGYEALPSSVDVEEVDDGASVDEAEEAAEERKGVQDAVGRSGWWRLAGSFGASAGLTIAGFFFPVLGAIPLFNVFGNSLASKWLWWFSPSLSYIGQGVIMGLPTTLSMNVGMLVGWAVLSPLSYHRGWAPGPPASSSDGARGWILWTALAIMIAESLVGLLPIAAETVQRYASGIPSSKQADAEEDHDDETPDRLVPAWWVWVGLCACTVGGTGLIWAVFGAEGIRPWATVVGIAMASVFSLLGVRALGETDLNPVSGIGKISQLVFSVLQPGNVVANLLAGGIAEAGAQQAGDLMQDLKTGHLLRASPRSQFYGQLIGSFASVFVSTAAYKIYTATYTIPGPTFPAPQAAIWLNLARLVNSGSLPPRAKEFMTAFGIVFGGLSALRVWLDGRGQQSPGWVRFLPSGVAFAIGFLNTPSFSIARLIGGIISHVSLRRLQRTQRSPPRGPAAHLADLALVVLASGFVLGEGFASVLVLALKSAGAEPASCWGCGAGGGGYCGGC